MAPKDVEAKPSNSKNVQPAEPKRAGFSDSIPMVDSTGAASNYVVFRTERMTATEVGKAIVEQNAGKLLGRKESFEISKDFGFVRVTIETYERGEITVKRYKDSEMIHQIKLDGKEYNNIQFYLEMNGQVGLPAADVAGKDGAVWLGMDNVVLGNTRMILKDDTAFTQELIAADFVISKEEKEKRIMGHGSGAIEDYKVKNVFVVTSQEIEEARAKYESVMPQMQAEWRYNPDLYFKQVQNPLVQALQAADSLVRGADERLANQEESQFLKYMRRREERIFHNVDVKPDEPKPFGAAVPVRNTETIVPETAPAHIPCFRNPAQTTMIPRSGLITNSFKADLNDKGLMATETKKEALFIPQTEPRMVPRVDRRFVQEDKDEKLGKTRKREDAKPRKERIMPGQREAKKGREHDRAPKAMRLKKEVPEQKPKNKPDEPRPMRMKAKNPKMKAEKQRKKAAKTTEAKAEAGIMKKKNGPRGISNQGKRLPGAFEPSAHGLRVRRSTTSGNPRPKQKGGRRIQAELWARDSGNYLRGDEYKKISIRRKGRKPKATAGERTAKRMEKKENSPDRISSEILGGVKPRTKSSFEPVSRGSKPPILNRSPPRKEMKPTPFRDSRRRGYSRNRRGRRY